MLIDLSIDWSIKVLVWGLPDCPSSFLGASQQFLLLGMAAREAIKNIAPNLSRDEPGKPQMLTLHTSTGE
jgi:hypothetical protein